jgi:hypothetical protein
MKKFLLLSLLILLLLSSCDNEEKTIVEKGIKFSFSTTAMEDSSGGRIEDLPEPATLMVTIKDGSGTTIADRKDLTLYKFGETFLSAPLTLKTSEGASYSLTEFFVIDANNQVVYITPKEGSEMAHLVTDALDINFAITKDNITTVTPEVLALDDTADPQHYGYGQFGFNVVKTISTVFSSFVKGLNNFELTDSHLRIEGFADTGSDTAPLWSQEVDLQAKANIIVLREAESYRVTATKAGFQPWQRTVVLLDNDKIEILFNHQSEGQFETVWNKHFGGSQSDRMKKAFATSDGGTILFCNSESNDYDATGRIDGPQFISGYSDFWIVKLRANGEIEWKHRYGTQYSDHVSSVVEYPDGSGYLVNGWFFRMQPSKGWLLKISMTGELMWERYITEVFDNVMMANTGSNNFVLVSSRLERQTPDRNILSIMQIDAEGNTMWSKRHAWNYDELPNYLSKFTYPTSNGYVVVSPTKMAMVNNSGDLVSTKMFSKEFTDDFNANPILIKKVTGFTVYGTKKENEDTGSLFALSLDEAGNELEGKDIVVDGMKKVHLEEALSLPTGNSLLIGMASTLTSIYGPTDGLILEVNPEGIVVKKNQLPPVTMGTSQSCFFSVLPVTDNEFVVAGDSYRFGYNNPGNYGETDIWVMKLKF